MNSSQRFRARIVLGAIVCAALALVVSLYSTAIVKGASYAAKADAQYARPASAVFDRGTIYFSSFSGGAGKTPVRTAAATVERGYTVYMNPSLVKDAENTYQAVSQYLAIEKSTFLAKAAKADDPYEELARKVADEPAESLRKLNISGIDILPESWRSYPGNIMAAHVLGLVGEDGASSAISGRYGLELSYDDILSREGVGSAGSLFAGLFSDVAGSVFGADDSEVGHIVTSIEPTVERYLEKVLGEIDAAWQPDEVGGIIIDPSTGEIAAMASLPSFDPNNTAATKQVSIFSNPLVEHVYEMGSIVKPLTMAAALDAGAVRVDSRYDDVGCMTLDKRKICNYDGRARGPGTAMQDILSQSLNIGAATIALETGPAEFASYFKAFGMAEKTGIDLPNEATPLSKNLNSTADIDIATASYGQGIAVSPVGMARALSALANGGYLVEPHVVKEVDYLHGRVVTTVPEKIGPVLKPETVDDVRKMLVTVVDSALKGGAIKNDRYTIAAKTGTASIANPVAGGYYTDRYLHSFFGFFPAYNPRFLVFLYQVHPKGARFASDTLTEPFDELTGFLLNYYNIPPDR